MKEPITINLHDNRGKRWVNWLALMFTLAFQAFCIWLSQGSTWWTFVTGTLFLMILTACAISAAHKDKTSFRGLDELQVWLDRQKVIESLPPGEIIITPPAEDAERRAGSSRLG